jgi:hypothetical protein
MSSPRTLSDSARAGVAAVASLLPLAVFPLVGFLAALPTPAIAGWSIRYVGSWRAWAWVAGAVTVGATIGGWVVWTATNAHCEVQEPLAPALAAGISVLVGSLTGAGLAGTSGSTVRAVAGLVIGPVAALVVLVSTAFLAMALGLPSLLFAVSHC